VAPLRRPQNYHRNTDTIRTQQTMPTTPGEQGDLSTQGLRNTLELFEQHSLMVELGGSQAQQLPTARSSDHLFSSPLLPQSISNTNYYHHHHPPPLQHWGHHPPSQGWGPPGLGNSQDSVSATQQPPAEVLGAVERGRKGKAKEKSLLKRWTMEERELLLEWFSQDPINLERYKTKPTDTCEKISREVFNGVRSAHAIDAQWDAMKNKHKEACTRLQGTGEGERDLQELRGDDEEWEGIQVGWLRKFCPYFEMIDEILARDRSYLAPYASEAGGEEDLAFRSGQRVRSEDEAGDSGNDPDDHPPVRGSKIPATGRATNGGALKRGVATGSDVGKKAVKKVKVEDLVTQHKARMEFDKEKFDYEKERDGRWMKFVEKKEENRHKEAVQRMRLLQLKMMKDMGMDPNEDLDNVF